MTSPASTGPLTDLDKLDRDQLEGAAAAVAECIGRAIHRRADDRTHRVGTFLDELADRGYVVVDRAAAPAPRPRRAPTAAFTPPTGR